VNTKSKADLAGLQAMSAIEVRTMLELTDDDTLIMEQYTDEQQKLFNKLLTETMAAMLGDSEEFLSMDQWMRMRCEFHVAMLDTCQTPHWDSEFTRFAKSYAVAKP
jgi:hypothetical protein